MLRTVARAFSVIGGRRTRKTTSLCSGQDDNRGQKAELLGPAGLLAPPAERKLLILADVLQGLVSTSGGLGQELTHLRGLERLSQSELHHRGQK